MLRAEEKRGLCSGSFPVTEGGITLLCETCSGEVLRREACGFSTTKAALPFGLAPGDIRKEKEFLDCSLANNAQQKK